MDVNVALMPYQYALLVTAPDATADQPAENMLTMHRFQKTKLSGSVGQTTYVIEATTETSGKLITAVGLYSNLLPDDLIKIETFSENTFLPADLIETIEEPVMSPFIDPEWRPGELSFGYLNDDFSVHSEKLFTNYNLNSFAKGIRFTITLPGSRDFEISYLYAGDKFVPNTNVSAVYTNSYESYSGLGFGAQGDPLISSGGMVQRITIDWPMLTEHERQRLFLMSRRLLRKRKAILTVYPSLGHYKRVIDQMWGLIDEPIEIVRREAQGDIWTASMSMIAPYVEPYTL